MKTWHKVLVVLLTFIVCTGLVYGLVLADDDTKSTKERYQDMNEIGTPYYADMDSESHREDVTAETLDQKTVVVEFTAPNETAYRCAYETYPSAYENQTSISLNRSDIKEFGEEKCGITVLGWFIE